MKDYVDVKIDNLEARFLCELLYERYHKLIKQRPELIKKKYSLITSIVINHRRIMEGDRPAFFGLVTHTVDGLIEKNKHLYKEMSDRDEVIRHNEVVLETVLTPQIAGHNLKNKLGLIKFGNHDINTKKIYS